MTKCGLCKRMFEGNGTLCPECRAVMFGCGNKSGNKMHAERTLLDGIWFASKLEARRYAYLKMLERAGKIRELKMQVPFELIPKTKGRRATKYLADFTYYDENGNYVVEDTKAPPSRTAEYRVKKKLMHEKYGITIKEVESNEF